MSGLSTREAAPAPASGPAPGPAPEEKKTTVASSAEHTLAMQQAQIDSLNDALTKAQKQISDLKTAAASARPAWIGTQQTEIKAVHDGAEADRRAIEKREDKKMFVGVGLATALAFLGAMKHNKGLDSLANLSTSSQDALLALVIFSLVAVAAKVLLSPGKTEKAEVTAREKQEVDNINANYNSARAAPRT